ncbi:hypothetical protein NDU88_008066 [Pleurodeles waltl]|uniref:Uncharacterized protein n=1 Tax=Pleurodeles waltl TaxID=8319 RepID=A0AAV7N8M8_PLEWA|nr:hypothetical protein NDU88_008066 [Pleurodeles waltl]
MDGLPCGLPQPHRGPRDGLEGCGCPSWLLAAARPHFTLSVARGAAEWAKPGRLSSESIMWLEQACGAQSGPARCVRECVR